VKGEGIALVEICEIVSNKSTTHVEPIEEINKNIGSPENWSFVKMQMNCSIRLHSISERTSFKYLELILPTNGIFSMTKNKKK
jgi:hypothetical protein